MTEEEKKTACLVTAILITATNLDINYTDEPELGDDIDRVIGITKKILDAWGITVE